MKTKNFSRPAIIIIAAIAVTIFSLQSDLNNNSKGNSNDCKIPKLSPHEITYYHAGWEYLKTRDPITNKIPFNIKAKELKYVSGLPSRDNFINRSDNKTAPYQYRSQSWESKGPDNVCGRIKAIEIDIKNNDILLAGVASGGLWRSTDGGGSWVKTTAQNVVQSVTCIEQDMREGKTNTWYYGTGELLSTTDRQFSVLPRTLGYGNGIFKSVDNGATWTLLQSTSGGGIIGELTEAFQGIWNIEVDQLNQEQDIVYAAVYGGIMRSADGGETWTHVLGDLITKSFSTDVAISPDGTIYAAIGTFSPNEFGALPDTYGIFKSTDGISWTSITPHNFHRHYRNIKIELAPANPNVLYILTETPIPDTDPVFGFSASKHSLWKVSDLNTEEPEWVEYSENLPGKGEGNILKGFYHPEHGYCSIGGYAMTINTHPEDENVVYIGGTNLYRNDLSFSDSTYTHLIGGYPYDGAHNNLHPDIHYTKVVPSNTNIMFCACDGGIFKTMNCLEDSVVWQYVSDDLASAQLYWVGIDHQGVADDFVISGCQDNGIYLHDRYFPSNTWDFLAGGDGLTCQVADNKTYAIISVYNGCIISLTFDDELNIENEIYQVPDMVSRDDFIFYTHFIIDRADNKKFYMAAKNKILRKDDMEAAASDTTLVNTGWQWLDNTGLKADEFITAINTSKEPANVLYYGSCNGKVFRMDDANTGNPVATELTSNIFPINAYVGFIEVDEHDANNIFVVFSNYNIQSIFNSNDGGESWVNLSGNLEEYPDGSGGGPSVRCVRMLHYDDGVAYFVATSAGLFSTFELNGDQTVWLQEGVNEIGNIIVDNIDTRESDGWIVIATQGTGAFSTVFDPSGIEDVPLHDQVVLKQNWPNPCNDETKINFSIKDACNIQLKLVDINGKVIMNIADSYFETGEHSVLVNTSLLPPGSYFYRLEANSEVSTKRMIVL